MKFIKQKEKIQGEDILNDTGSKIEKIRKSAKRETEKMLESPVELRLHVNITPDWSTNPAGLRKMGYE